MTSLCLKCQHYQNAFTNVIGLNGFPYHIGRLNYCKYNHIELPRTYFKGELVPDVSKCEGYKATQPNTTSPLQEKQ